MTLREFYTNIANGTITQNEIDFAVEGIAKLDATNEKRKAKAAEGQTKKAEENAPIKAAILATLSAEPQTAPQIAAIVGVTHNKVTPLAKQLVAEGKAEQIDIKVPGKGPAKAYVLVDAE
jgi:predicted HTH transcriptional regulator